MGCTHSKNTKSKKPDEKPLNRDKKENQIPHFDSRNGNSDSHEDPTQQHYSRQILNESYENHKKLNEKLVSNKNVQEAVPLRNSPIALTARAPTEDVLPPAIAPVKEVCSTYIPVQPEKKIGLDQGTGQVKSTQVLPNLDGAQKKKKEPSRDKITVVGPSYRPHLTSDDLECIRRSVQQRNERRAYMMTHRNEQDDTLYELEFRMPERDYTSRFDRNSNSKVY